MQRNTDRLSNPGNSPGHISISTLCHEFRHHRDFQQFGFSNSWHTRSCYERAASLYRQVRGATEAIVLSADFRTSLAD
ncbi:MAG: hypothetical protein M3O09_06040 [Acidobacteriota bacterium]|nr:hypothetical protein [Acidobacteriota bacterium]